MNLSGKRALITGGSGGLGQVLAADFADAGAEVHIAGRRRASLDRAVATMPYVTVHLLDVTDEAATDALFASLGGCDIVIANAGIAESAPLHHTSLDQWQQIMAVNLTGCFLTFRAGLRALRAADVGWGRLVAISSIMGLAGYRYASAYSAAKHGVNGLVRSVAAELATSGITANALCPGYLDTEMTDRSITNIVKRTGMTADEAQAVLAGMSPLGRLITPAEVSRAALWLCGPGSDAVNGQTIAINGGKV
jgi:NAD(P)-dependent dehydrogenase (short-subunit alcohol dehydrogenase family)